MSTIRLLTVIFIMLTPFVCSVNAYWCWANRYCNGESQIMKLKSRLWASIGLALVFWIAANLIDHDTRVRSWSGILCGFCGATILFSCACRFLAFHLGGGRTLHPDGQE